MSNPLLLTGATGFLGRTIRLQLSNQLRIIGLGRQSGNEVICQLDKEIPIFQTSFEGVVHAAGMAHIQPKNKNEANAFFEINHIGTLNLLRALQNCPSLPRFFVLISTIAVYGIEKGENIDENFTLNGKSPYAKSKILAEKEVIEWCTKNGVTYLILRLPLVVGDGAPGNLGAIEKAIQDGRYFKIVGNNARKSVVRAEDIALLIPELAGKQGIFNLTDGVHPTFSEIEDAIAKKVEKRIKRSLPLSVVKILALIGDILETFHLPSPLNSDKLLKMTSTLTFDDQLARKQLGWNPRPAYNTIENA